MEAKRPPIGMIQTQGRNSSGGRPTLLQGRLGHLHHRGAPPPQRTHTTMMVIFLLRYARIHRRRLLVMCGAEDTRVMLLAAARVDPTKGAYARRRRLRRLRRHRLHRRRLLRRPSHHLLRRRVQAQHHQYPRPHHCRLRPLRRRCCRRCGHPASWRSCPTRTATTEASRVGATRWARRATLSAAAPRSMHPAIARTRMRASIRTRASGAASSRTPEGRARCYQRAPSLGVRAPRQAAACRPHSAATRRIAPLRAACPNAARICHASMDGRVLIATAGATSRRRR